MEEDGIVGYSTTTTLWKINKIKSNNGLLKIQKRQERDTSNAQPLANNGVSINM